MTTDQQLVAMQNLENFRSWSDNPNQSTSIPALSWVLFRDREQAEAKPKDLIMACNDVNLFGQD